LDFLWAIAPVTAALDGVADDGKAIANQVGSVGFHCQ